MITTRSLVVVTITAGLSVGLSLLRLFEMPQGGSVTLEALPILYVALAYGLKHGFAAGALSGVVQLLVRPFIVHPVQVVMDYPLAMMCLGVAGAFRPLVIDRLRQHGAALVTGVALVAAAVLFAASTRFAIHLVSGVVFFSAYAPEGQNVWLYSAIYNGAYMLPQAVIFIAILPPVLRRALPDDATRRN